MRRVEVYALITSGNEENGDPSKKVNSKLDDKGTQQQSDGRERKGPSKKAQRKKKKKDERVVKHKNIEGRQNVQFQLEERKTL